MMKVTSPKYGILIVKLHGFTVYSPGEIPAFAIDTKYDKQQAQHRHRTITQKPHTTVSDTLLDL